MQKILVVGMNYLGDALMTTPGHRALRRAYPQARIDAVVGVGPSADILRGNPDIDEIIVRTAKGSWARCVQVYRLLRERRYDMVVILPPLPAYALTAFLARTPQRVGRAGRGMDLLLTQLRHTRAPHMADAMLDTMPVPQSARPEERRLIAVIPPESRQAIQSLLAEVQIDTTQTWIAVNVGTTRPQKRWSAQSFAETLDRLPNVPAVLLGAGADDTKTAAEIMRITQHPRLVNLVGRTSVAHLAAMIEACDVLLSADSGPMHLSAAVGTPVVALFGSTDPLGAAPYDEISHVIYHKLPCSPCDSSPTCGGTFECMRLITPDEVALAMRAKLRERQGLPVATLPFAAIPLDIRPSATAPKSVPTSPAYQRILIATKFRFIGDTLLAIPIFRAVRTLWPQAHITLLTGRNARVLLQNNPYLDEILEFEPTKADQGLGKFFGIVNRLRTGRYDLSLTLNRSFHSALIPWLAGIRDRAGFTSEGRSFLLRRRVPYDVDKSEIDCYFDVLRTVVPDAPRNHALELWVSEQERGWAIAQLKTAFPNGGFLIGLQPGASLEIKRWEAERFARVADALVQRVPNVHLLLVGGPDERALSEQMLSSCAPETQSRTVSFAGSCDLRQSLALVAQLRLFIGNDTAILHSAVALQVPTVALFGPTNPRKWGNFGPRQRVLEAADGAMASISVESVVAAALELV